MDEQFEDTANDHHIVVDFSGHVVTATPDFPRCTDCGSKIASGDMISHHGDFYHERCRW